MKKKIIINKEKLTRELRLFPSLYNNHPPSVGFENSADSERVIEKFNGYWKITFRDKKSK